MIEEKLWRKIINNYKKGFIMKLMLLSFLVLIFQSCSIDESSNDYSNTHMYEGYNYTESEIIIMRYNRKIDKATVFIDRCKKIQAKCANKKVEPGLHLINTGDSSHGHIRIIEGTKSCKVFGDDKIRENCTIMSGPHDPYCFNWTDRGLLETTLKDGDIDTYISLCQKVKLEDRLTYKSIPIITPVIIEPVIIEPVIITPAK